MIENPNTIAAVIGHPILHSRSPLIHNDWLTHAKIDGTYSAIDVAPSDLKAFCEGVRTSNVTGFNVTLPHKEAILSLCDDIDSTAKKIGAANTIHIKKQRLYASNTDAYGFWENLKQSVPDFDTTSSSALVLGAGGAARAVLYALQSAKIPNITLTNRTRTKAETLAHDFGGNIHVIDWDQRVSAISQTNFVINTTSLGMQGGRTLDVDISAMPANSVVYDLVYNPLQTDLLKQAEQNGYKPVNGLGMLVYQAEKAFETWFNVKPNITDALMATLKEGL